MTSPGIRFNAGAERQLARSLAVLGLRPGASEQDAEAAYFARLSSLAGREKSEVAESLKELDRAIRFIRVSHRLASRKERTERAPDPAADAYDRALRLLGLTPGATEEQVDAAIEDVRNTVSDPAKLREFHRAAGVVKNPGRTTRRKPAVRRSRRLWIFSTLLLALTVLLGFQISSRLRHRLVRFDAGDTVYRMEDGERFGVVLGFEKNHPMPNGTDRDAYNIALHPDGKQAWVSARTAQSALRKAP